MYLIQSMYNLNNDHLIIEFNETDQLNLLKKLRGFDIKKIRKKRSNDALFNLTGDTMELNERGEIVENQENVTVRNEQELLAVRKPVYTKKNVDMEWRREYMKNEDIGYFYDSAWDVNLLSKFSKLFF